MTKKDAVAPNEKSDSANFWEGFPRVEKAGAPAVAVPASPENAVAPAPEGLERGVSIYGRIPAQVGGLQSAEWAGIRKSLKKALSTPAAKKAPTPGKSWSAATPQDELDLDWAEGDEARLKNTGKAAPAVAQKQSQLWTRSVARSARPGSRRNAPSLWSLARALFQKNQNDPPTGQ